MAIQRTYGVTQKPATGTIRKTVKAPANLEEAIAARAYELYQQRGAAVSSAEEQANDWQQAEREIKEKFGLN
jgi:hypothetical protein